MHLSTRIPRLLCAGVVLTLLSVSGCALGTAEGAPRLLTVQPKRIDGVSLEKRSMDVDGLRISTVHPVVPGARPFSTEIRTTMAEQQTAFMTAREGDGEASLEQKAEFLAASDDVLGARITTRRANGGSEASASATTRWYDASTGEVLPWTALFRGEDAIRATAAEVARVLHEEEGVELDEQPEGLGQSAISAAPSNAAEDAPSDPVEVAAEEAWKLAAKLDGSPLEDVGFGTTGGLIVSFPGEPGEEGAGERSVALDADFTRPLLSAFGERALTAATSEEKEEKVDLGNAPSAAGPTPTLDCARVPCVALTFDDGPGKHTGRLLDDLADYSAKATFYVLGTMVEEAPDVVARAAREGHEIANHTWKHDDLTGKSGKGVAADLARTAKAIEKATGTPPRTMRPPYGAYDDTSLKHTDYPVIMWDVDTLDWMNRDTRKITKIATTETTPGSIVLFHDIHAPTIDAIPTVLRTLHEQGYHFVTVTELFGDTELEPGTIYRRRD
ncbi:polysaccharide deacetylase family protein [Nocardiopsis gilva]|uniref:polysaccharide deacetylase family protein n=1 Tax=Nocardiopsis gilva TaxID=280236 RepID=UPI000349C95E|nr:polysaccharide deacetylase family protein [Nocardiopsis gilva]